MFNHPEFMQMVKVYQWRFEKYCGRETTPSIMRSVQFLCLFCSIWIPLMTDMFRLQMETIQICGCRTMNPHTPSSSAIPVPLLMSEIRFVL